MIASDAGTVHELNERARADRVAAGVVSENGVRLENGQEAGVGDEIFTRQNERRLVAGSRWVKNGDHFLVTATNNDGSLSVRSISRGGELRLPAAYVVEHVELAYATTAFRAQGRTVETAHALVSPSTTREVLYVAATRGHECNQLYVDTHFDPDPSTGGHDGPVPRQSARDVLSEVLAKEGAELSAHETLQRAQRQADDPVVLAAEYETILRVAQEERWEALLRRSGLSPGCLTEM